MYKESKFTFWGIFCFEIGILDFEGVAVLYYNSNDDKRIGRERDPFVANKYFGIGE